VPCGDAFYGLSINGDAGNLPKWEGPLVCIDRATGKQLWAQTGFKSGSSLISADGLLFARSFQSLYLVEASSKGYVEKGKIEKLHDVTNAQGKDGGWVMPVLSRGQLYIRTPNELICYKVK
jgi:outer membrane protein assembly factor BamB